MTATYIVCDGQRRMATIEVPMFGKRRHVLAMFSKEEDALQVGAEVERLSGVPHFVKKIGTSFTAQELGWEPADE